MKLIGMLAVAVAALTLTATAVAAPHVKHKRWNAMTTAERSVVVKRDIHVHRTAVQWWLHNRPRQPQTSGAYRRCRAIGIQAPGVICVHGQKLVGALHVQRRMQARVDAATARALARSTDWRAYLRRLVGDKIARACALPLIGRESGGGVTKWNTQGSGAYGLGQALPAKKMAAYGSDYMTNGVTQIKWLNVYVGKYGGWCGANAWQASHNTY